MILEGTLIWSLFTPYSTHFRMVICRPAVLCPYCRSCGGSLDVDVPPVPGLCSYVALQPPKDLFKRSLYSPIMATQTKFLKFCKKP